MPIWEGSGEETNLTDSHAFGSLRKWLQWVKPSIDYSLSWHLISFMIDSNRFQLRYSLIPDSKKQQKDKLLLS